MWGGGGGCVWLCECVSGDEISRPEYDSNNCEHQQAGLLRLRLRFDVIDACRKTSVVVIAVAVVVVIVICTRSQNDACVSRNVRPQNARFKKEQPGYPVHQTCL